ncbi:MAG: hypothetical protein ABIJ45_09655 [Candidatus Zixiibacteriota bacterium]
MRKFQNCSFLILVLVIILASASWGEVPKIINYQGRLTTNLGAPLDTTVSIIFAIYDDSTGGNMKWSETQGAVVVTDGIFNVLLGSSTQIMDTVFNNENRYLGIQIGTDPEISPRTRIVSVGYALHAKTTDTADVCLSAAGDGGWTDNGSTVNLTTETDQVVVGPMTPTTPSLKMDIRGHGGASSPMLRLYFNTTYPSDLTYPAFEVYSGAYNYTPISILGGGSIYQYSSSKSTEATQITNKISAGLSDPTFFNGGNVGIGTDNPGNRLHVSGSDAEPILNIEQNGTGRGARFSASTACALWVENAGNHGLRITNANGDGIHVENAGGYAAYLNGKGFFRDNVGIGISNPIDKLEVAGTIHSTTGGFRFPDGTTQTTAASVSGSEGIPSGVILMWSGALSDIPTGWILCDGANGTPDLTNKFVYGISHGEDPGAQGGQLSHSHNVTISTLTGAPTSTVLVTDGGTRAVADANHNHTVNGSTPTSNDTALPPYYKLAYIMKQ